MISQHVDYYYYYYYYYKCHGLQCCHHTGRIPLSNPAANQ